MRRILEPGIVFGRLTILREGPRAEDSARTRRWWCRCMCGREVLISRTHLYPGGSRSCGCLSVERNTVHGDATGSPAPEYNAWCNMIARCINQKHPSYSYYGGRGISVCMVWQRSYPAFLRGVGRRPSRAYTLGRIDNDGNYEPGNVRWETWGCQSRNKRGNRILVINGEALPVVVWAERYAINPNTVRSRLFEGWDPKRAVSVPVARRHLKSCSRRPRLVDRVAEGG